MSEAQFSPTLLCTINADIVLNCEPQCSHEIVYKKECNCDDVPLFSRTSWLYCDVPLNQTARNAKNVIYLCMFARFESIINKENIIVFGGNHKPSCDVETTR